MVVNGHVGNVFRTASGHVATHAIRLSSDSCLGAKVRIGSRMAGITSIVEGLFPGQLHANVRIMAGNACKFPRFGKALTLRHAIGM